MALKHINLCRGLLYARAISIVMVEPSEKKKDKL